MNDNYQAPGDKRRFCHYARNRNLKFQIADPLKTYDLVVLSQNADLSIWSNYNRGNTKIIYDFIDSYLAVPKSQIKGRLRGMAKYVAGQSKYLRVNHWKSLELMCSRADAVVCSTDEQALDIKPFCSNVHQILDAHTSIDKCIKKNYMSGDIFNIVWEGQASNVYQFDLLRTVLSKVEEKNQIALHFVTDLSFKRFAGKFWKTYTEDIVKGLCNRVYVYDWNEFMCPQIISSCDLALIPIDVKDPFAKGKPENKLLLFWRLGMPVVTTATPAYVRAMNKAGLDMTCDTEDEWVTKINKYIASEDARKNAGVSGRNTACKNYSEDDILSRWDNLIASVL